MMRLKNLLNMGISDTLDLVETNKQRVFNLFILLALPAMPFVLFFNIWRSNYSVAILNTIQLVFIFFAFWISYKRRYLFLRTFLLVLLSTIIFFTAIFFKTGIEYRLLLIMVVGVILFDNNIKFLLFSILLACEFTICKYLDFKAINIEGVLLATKSMQVFIPFMITCFSLFYLKFIYLQSQFKLQNALKKESHSNEMQEKLMFSLAHDLRSPLGNVIGLVQLLKRHEGFTNEELKWLDMIESSTANSNALVNELLESNELMKHRLKLQLIDLNELIDNVVLTSRIKASTKNIQIHFQKNASIPIATIDALKFERLISNLINNAIKFSYPFGNIYILLEAHQDKINISIRDEGIGIAEKYINSIFDPFTKAKRIGTNNEASFGLGLSICKQIATLHAGTIDVKSELGKGTEFILSFPKIKPLAFL